MQLDPIPPPDRTSDRSGVWCGMGAPRRASTALLATTVIFGLGCLDTASGDFASNTSKGSSGKPKSHKAIKSNLWQGSFCSPNQTIPKMLQQNGAFEENAKYCETDIDTEGRLGL